jgi:autotransporter translocation and assembly factor TamB
LRLRAGTTRLSIDGHLGPTRALDLDFSLDADNLGLLAEGARGTLHADGTVAGSSGAPVIRLNAQGSGIKHEGVLLDKLDANVDIDWRGQRASHADVTIAGLTVDNRVLTQFNAVLDGTTSEHAFRVDALAGRTSLHLSGKGSFVNQVWNANIADLFIDDTASINLQLDAPVRLTASAKTYRSARCACTASRDCAVKARGTTASGMRTPTRKTCRSALTADSRRAWNTKAPSMRLRTPAAAAARRGWATPVPTSTPRSDTARQRAHTSSASVRAR